ncbi:MAG: asparagine synthase (glutamine-hydrolyzing) [Cyclobacteriaceae bacterium]
MCGITGLYAFNELGRFHMIKLAAATEALESRGPDAGQHDLLDRVGLGHRRLSIIDTSREGNQPMRDASGRYTIVFNGEIYNYRELRQRLGDKGITFASQTDTEVLLYWFIHHGIEGLSALNGFFAFALYDAQEERLWLARDRFGIKPLLYYHDEDKFFFASEMKSLLAYGVEKELDYTSLYHYLQLNYIPAPYTIFQKVNKLLSGQYLEVAKGNEKRVQIGTYYQLQPNPDDQRIASLSYEAQQQRLRELLDQSVQRRLVADVPLGSFLSGGIDSSVITGLARQHVSTFNTFSIGYRDEPFFDETRYAKLVAQKFETNHTVFSLTNDDLYRYLHEAMNYLSEPFADSSALPVYILSKETKQRVTVALSGDGADEIFSGYHKHLAAYRAMHPGWAEQMVDKGLPIWQKLPQSRSGWLANKARQLQRFGEGMQLSPKERYWRWATYLSSEKATRLLSNTSLEKLEFEKADVRQAKWLDAISDEHEHINQWLLADTQLVLPNDMLTKVDLMSMANGLEVRVPFLDHEVVEFAFQLPEATKINRRMKKRIVQDAFRDMLPAELYNRPKHGFEVPLLRWFRTELKSTITGDLLADAYIEEQGIFDVEEIQLLKKQLFSSNPGDIHATIWALLVFQWWWKQYGN